MLSSNRVTALRWDRSTDWTQRRLCGGMPEDLLGRSHRLSHFTQCRSHGATEYTPSCFWQIESFERWVKDAFQQIRGLIGFPNCVWEDQVHGKRFLGLVTLQSRCQP